MSQTNENGHKYPLSEHIFGTLAWINSHVVYEDQLVSYNQNTTAAICKYIVRGMKDSSGRRRIHLNEYGHERLRQYTDAGYARRHREGISAPPDENLTERVNQMIARVRVMNVRTFRKSA